MIRECARNSDFRNAEFTSDIGHGRARTIVKLILAHPRLSMAIDGKGSVLRNIGHS